LDREEYQGPVFFPRDYTRIEGGLDPVYETNDSGG